MNRRNFITSALTGLAALATRKWPAIEWPEPVKRAAEVKEFGWDDMLNDDLDSLTGAAVQLGGGMRRTLEAELFETGNEPPEWLYAQTGQLSVERVEEALAAMNKGGERMQS